MNKRNWLSLPCEPKEQRKLLSWSGGSFRSANNGTNMLQSRTGREITRGGIDNCYRKIISKHKNVSRRINRLQQSDYFLSLAHTLPSIFVAVDRFVRSFCEARLFTRSTQKWACLIDRSDIYASNQCMERFTTVFIKFIASYATFKCKFEL